VPLGVESDGRLGVALLGVELSLGVVVAGGMVAGGVDGMVVVGGDADGARSPGRSPTRSVFDSEQAVSRPALSVSAQTAVSSLFIAVPPSVGLRVANRTGGLQRTCRQPPP
jgi:hypothetical protein